jgi:dipeptidyl aminopeptidase/acylaminoacyl peptidase
MFGLTSISSPAQPKVEEFGIADFAHQIGLADPQVSPDQRRVAYVRRSANEDLRYQYEIVLEHLVDAERSRRTAPNQYAHTPRWVSNSELSVLASTKDNGHQVFPLDVDNGGLKQDISMNTPTIWLSSCLLQAKSAS